MENKERLKKEKIKEIQKKLVKFLLTSIAILIFVTITLKQFSDETLGVKDIRTMIGTEYSGGESLTIMENLILRTAVDTYIKNIYSGDYTKAYNTILPRYREIVTEEVFTEAMNQIGAENFVIEAMELEQLAERLFAFHITIKNDNKLELLLVLDSEKYYIVPEPFLEYKQVNESIKKNGVQYTLKDYQVDVERCVFNMTLENTANKEVLIDQVKMKNQSAGSYIALNQKVTLAPGETKDVSFVVETHLDFPKSLELIRLDNEKVRVYTFELE